MQKNNSISKKLTIFGIVIVCAVVIIGLYFHVQGPIDGDDSQITENAVQNITPDGVAETPAVAPLPVIQPESIISDTAPGETPTTEPLEIYNMELEENVTVLTVMPEKPEPPELPDTAFRGEREGDATPEDAAAHQALDPALTNPGVRPDGIPAPPPINNTAQGEPVIGDTIYFPGFGWITYTGPNIGERSTSTGDWDKIIGSMN